MKFKPFQIADYSAAAMTPGCLLAHDTGLGKSLAAVTVPLLWLGYDPPNPNLNPNPNLSVRGSVLIVAPGDLHDQLCAEFKKFFGIVPTQIADQAALQRLKVNGRIPPGFYLTSYTRLAVNGVKKIADLIKGGTESAVEALNLRLPDLQRFYDQRGVIYKDDYASLAVTCTCTQEQLDGALLYRERKINRETDDAKLRQRLISEAYRCHALLSNFTPPFVPAIFKNASQKVKFIWRELVATAITEYSAGIGETRLLARQAGEGHNIKCVYSPSMADLCDTLFDCVVVDEGVKMKGTTTQVGRGIRQMKPRHRLVLTATPVKNRLPDLFWLAWWAAGGSEEATARFPYAGGADELERFASKFMLSEFNKTKCENDNGGKAPSRFTKLRPEICNLHLLWKIMAPNILRRRKADITLTDEELREIGLLPNSNPTLNPNRLVNKIRHVYRVPMGLHQRRVYEYHIHAIYLDCNRDPAPGAKLQALRVAAAAPDSKLLIEKPLPARASPNLIYRSSHAFIPKVACALTLIKEILARGEQVAVFSAFNGPSDTLGKYLTEAGVGHFILDGRTSQRKRGRQSAAFNAGDCPVTLAGIDSMAEGHNWDKVNNVILTSYTWAADKIIQAVNRVHRLTSLRDINVYAILCDQSADRVLEDNITEKNNSADLAIDGRLLGEAAAERGMAELLRDAMADFQQSQDCPDESILEQTWPALREQLRLTSPSPRWRGEGRGEVSPPTIDLESFVFPPIVSIPSPSFEIPKMDIPKPPVTQPNYAPSWRRYRVAA